jgi:SagB-type dehydrogenase family enzyme
MTRRFRRSFHLVSYWANGRAVIYNYATGVQAEGTPLIWQILDFCVEWRTPSDLRQVAAGLDERTARKLVEALLDAGFVEASDRPRDPREERMEQWSAWNPAAGLFHSVSRQVWYGDRGLFHGRLTRKAAVHPMPGAVKSPVGPRVTLPTGDLRSPLARILRARRTWRQFSGAGIPVRSLAHVLRLTSGITHWLTIPGLGDVSLTTAPSGGSRHPIETYVITWRVRGLAPGVYRYAPDRHELEALGKGTTPAGARRLLPQQPWFGDAACLVVFAAVFARTQWRYEYARAYRTVMLEAGHRCQTLLLTATSLGLAPFCTLAIDEPRIERLIRADGIGESVLYAAGLGARPSRTSRAVLPRGTPALHVRPNDIRLARARTPNRREQP